jgi:serine protease AprX
MNLLKTDGTTISWNVSTIGNYRYEEGTVNISEVKNSAELVIYPNPAQGKVNISYQLPVSEQVSIGIYDLQGKAVQTWASEAKAAGKHELVWQAENLPKGSYILRFSTAKGSFSKTIILQ